jgi:hypothetical protein
LCLKTNHLRSERLMAICIVYGKCRETDTEVEYCWGYCREKSHTRFVIDNANPERPGCGRDYRSKALCHCNPVLTGHT